MNPRVGFCLLAVVVAATSIAIAAEDAPVTGKPALIVMDVQEAFKPYMDAEETERATGMINAAIAMFREQGLPVIRVYHSSLEGWPAADSEEFQFFADIAIEDSDPKIVKNYPSAFKKTDLEALLDELGCDTVFLAGLSSVGCVLATYFDASRLDVNVFMVRGALISHKAELTAAVEEFTDAVGYSAMKYMLAHAPR